MHLATDCTIYIKSLHDLSPELISHRLLQHPILAPCSTLSPKLLGIFRSDVAGARPRKLGRQWAKKAAVEARGREAVQPL